MGRVVHGEKTAQCGYDLVWRHSGGLRANSGGYIPRHLALRGGHFRRYAHRLKPRRCGGFCVYAGHSHHVRRQREKIMDAAQDGLIAQEAWGDVALGFGVAMVSAFSW